MRHACSCDAQVVNCFFDMLNGRDADKAKSANFRKQCYFMSSVFYPKLAAGPNVSGTADVPCHAQALSLTTIYLLFFLFQLISTTSTTTSG